MMVWNRDQSLDVKSTAQRHARLRAEWLFVDEAVRTMREAVAVCVFPLASKFDKISRSDSDDW
jgi:hypothetical protein